MTFEDENTAIKALSKEERVCHYRKLFISTDGDVYPCCRRLKHTKIGNICDEDIFKTIESAIIHCECSQFKCRPQTPEDQISLNYMNLELSLLCQAHCLICYTDSPNWKGTYDLYDRLEEIIDKYTPKFIIVQGGEVLVQEESLKWIEKIKNKHNNIQFQIVTNANVSLDKVNLIEKLFETMTVSFMGFQPETYKALMGIDMNKTMNLLNKLFENGKVNIRLKFVENLSSLHESPLFLEWAISKNPAKIYLQDADVMYYLTPDGSREYEYWSLLYTKTGEKIKKILLNNKDFLLQKQNYISFFKRNAESYGITPEFLIENQLEKAVIIT